MPVRTVRYYVAEGLLPGPGTRGKGATYGEEHLLRLLLIRQLVERRVPLKEIGERLSQLSTEDVRALVAQQARRAAELRRAADAPSPRAYIAALLAEARATPPPPAVSARRVADQSAAPGPSGGEEWQRWTVAPGVEVHVRADAAARYGKQIEETVSELRERLRKPAR